MSSRHHAQHAAGRSNRNLRRNALSGLGNQRGGPGVYGEAGETPSHPNVEKIRPNAACMLSIDDIKEFREYEKLWKEIFQIR